MLVALLAGAIAANVAASSPDSQTGQELLLRKGCTNCHGVLGPSSREGPDLLHVARGRGAAELLADMWNHVPQMSSALLSGERLPSLSGTELRELIGYLNFVNYLGDAGDGRHGQSLLGEMSCLGCHDLHSKGRIGPALFVPERPASAVGLVADLWNHYPNMSAALRDRGMTWFHWTGDVVTDISQYLRSLAPQGAPLALQGPGDPREGARLFAQLGCAGCHDPRGASWVEFMRRANRRSAAENGAVLLTHLPTTSAAHATRPLRPLTATNMADLLAYLGMGGADLPGGDPARGRQVFASRHCIVCHALPGAKPGIGPDVSSMPAITDPYEAAALMFAHARNMKIATELEHVPWPRMQPDELQDLYAFLRLERAR